MRRIFILMVLLLVSWKGFSQDKYIRYSEDPSYMYIKQYMPEYYYEGYLVSEDPKLKLTSSAGSKFVSVKVRVLRNYKDDKTFSYLLLRCGDEYETLFVHEIDPLISFLERVILLIDKKPDDHNYYVFNSFKGIYFKTEWTDRAGSLLANYPPYYELNMYFPKGESFKFVNKKQIQNLIFKLNAAKQYLPSAKTDFLRGEDMLEFKWEVEDVKGKLVET